MPHHSGRASKDSAGRSHWVLVICCLTVVFDGYDLIVYGTVVPDLLAYKEWGLTPAEAGHIGSLALFGMLVGALVVGTVTDAFGRRRVILACLVWFSTAMPLTALAPDPEIFGLLRFVTGLGLGGVVPSAIALTIEYSPEGRRQFNNALMFSGYSVGGVLAALLGLVLLPLGGFRIMFVVGMAPLVLVIPLVVRHLPESLSFLLAKGRTEEAAAHAERFGVPLPEERPAAGGSSSRSVRDAVGAVFAGRQAVITVLVWAISVLGLLLVYGLSTWLPQIMRRSGHSMDSTLTFFLIFNLGAVTGVILAGALADRLGEKLVISGAFGTAATAVLLFSLEPPTAPLLLLGAVAGFGSNTQTLVNAFVGGRYPVHARATALGWALAAGRIGAIVGPAYGGWILTRVNEGTLSEHWNFYAFAIPALVAALLILTVPRMARGDGAGRATAAERPPVTGELTTG